MSDKFHARNKISEQSIYIKYKCYEGKIVVISILC